MERTGVGERHLCNMPLVHFAMFNVYLNFPCAISCTRQRASLPSRFFGWKETFWAVVHTSLRAAELFWGKWLVVWKGRGGDELQTHHALQDYLLIVPYGMNTTPQQEYCKKRKGSHLSAFQSPSRRKGLLLCRNIALSEVSLAAVNSHHSLSLLGTLIDTLLHDPSNTSSLFDV